MKERLQEIYKETVNKVKVGGKVEKRFWTAKGVRLVEGGMLA